MSHFTVLETLWDVEKTCFSQHTDGTAGTLDCESRHPVLVENRFSNSFYGHPFHFAASIRAAISFLRKSGNSITINYLGGYLEQCRYVKTFMPAGIFYPFKLTDRSVIIGCNGSDI